MLKMLQLSSSSFQIVNPPLFYYFHFSLPSQIQHFVIVSFKYKPVTSGPAASLLQARQMTCRQEIGG